MNLIQQNTKLGSQTELMKVEKNYYRIELLELEMETRRKPVVFTGKYKHNDNPEWITFTTIRRYNPSEKTKTICDHINIKKCIVSQYLNLTEQEHNRKFYICGRVSTYEHFGDIRGCIILAETGSENPIWMTAQSKRENEIIVQRIIRETQQDATSNGNSAMLHSHR